MNKTTKSKSLSIPKKQQSNNKTSFCFPSRHLQQTHILGNKHKYQIKQNIASGAQGQVVHVVNRFTNHEYAIKIYEHMDLNEYPLKGTARAYLIEKECLKRLKEASTFGVINMKENWNILDKGYIVMTLGKGSLDVQDTICKQISPEDVQNVLTPWLLYTVLGVHKQQIIHYDIKPSNIIWVPRTKPKDQFMLTDFGLSCITDTKDTFAYCRGTIDYMSPEIATCLSLSSSLSSSSLSSDNTTITTTTTTNHIPSPNNTLDWWSVGVTLYELYCKRLPFYHSSMKQTIYNIINMEPPLLNLNDNDSLHTLLSGLLIKDHNKRWNDEQIQQYLLQYYPSFAL